MQYRNATPDDVEAVRECHVASIRAFGPDAYDDRQVDAWATRGDDAGDFPADDPDVYTLVAVPADAGAVDADAADAKDDDANTADADAADTDAADTDAAENVAGFAWVNLDDAEVTAVYVHPDHARTGVGTTLLRRLEARAREAGLDRLTLWSSLNAVEFYERRGWDRVERREHENTGGVVMDVVVMERFL